jgi:hypothetical protein
MTDRSTILQLLVHIPQNRRPSSELCCDVNLELWNVWCRATGRNLDRSSVWTEYDVIRSCALITERHLNVILQS